MDQVSYSGGQFSAVTAPHVAMVGAGDGRSFWVFGILVTIKVLGDQTGGSYACFENTISPGVGPPLHIHTQEAETWYLLDGEMIWTVGRQTFHAQRGSFMHLPPYVAHTFSNKFDKPAHMLLTYAPSGFETWFTRVGVPVKNSSAPGDSPLTTEEDLKKAQELAGDYGVIYAGPILDANRELKIEFS
ncbi:hypothetical protein Mapa_010819 [Marchantia paleacea]|nr:hypothetical protein Mapa_010819 [Marchantia paleacea]